MQKVPYTHVPAYHLGLQLYALEQTVYLIIDYANYQNTGTILRNNTYVTKTRDCYFVNWPVLLHVCSACHSFGM